jgi:hypothetical protein
VCHADALAAYRDSVHGVALARGVTDTPVCTDCHGEHRIQGPAEPTSPVFAANVGRETCGRCHGDARLNEKYGLPAGNVAAYEDSFHGMALRGGRLTVANCSSCHGVHDIRPSTDPRSHVNPANLAATCGKCHPGAGTKLQLGPVHKQRASLASGAVGWIRVVYLWLIGLAVGGMVLHNLADLARKAVTPLPPARALPDAPERMPRAVRLQHGLLMISFPILTYTGFALTYPEHWWAAPLLHWEATLGLRGGLHRAAALVMMGALLWHAVHVAVSPGLRVCLRGALSSRAPAVGRTVALRREGRVLGVPLGDRADEHDGARALVQRRHVALAAERHHRRGHRPPLLRGGPGESGDPGLAPLLGRVRSRRLSDGLDVVDR